MNERSAGACRPPPGRCLTVVTGVPRSGTSLLMQMLARGGLPITTDGARQPDEDNPRGYLEAEIVKRLGGAGDLREPVRAMAGTAVKVVAPLVPRLPAEFAYRVLLIRRDPAEILQSQQRMMARRGIPATGEDEALARAITASWWRVRSWVAGNPRAALMELDYADVVADPRAAAVSIDAFLGGGLDVEAMAAAVDPALHRCRAPPPAAYCGLPRARVT